MKKILVFAVWCGLIVPQALNVQAQEKCGSDLFVRQMIAKNPGLQAKVDQYKEQSKQWADAYEKQLEQSAMKTTESTNTLPIVFHVLLTQDELNSIGGTTGLTDRITAQIESLNHDYNATNSDNTQIPAAFKTLVGNPQISFGLAHRKTDGTATSGIEIGIRPVGFTGYVEQDASPKSSIHGGFDPWDNTKYINIWIVHITAGSSSQILGYSYSPGYAKTVVGDASLAGIILHYGAFGIKTASNSSQFWISPVIKGRTLTHEMGHYFDLWHIWGDDMGACPGDPNYKDDGIDDTPIQADMNQSTCPTFPKANCTNSSNGEMFMNYMDYVTDNCMHMFSTKQALHIRAQIAQGGPSYTLTQQIDLLSWPTDVAGVAKDNNFDVFPNPSTGNINVSFSKIPETLKSITVLNIMGQTVKQIKDINQNIYNIDLSGLGKGIYIVQCQFEEGVVNRKIALQ